MAASFDPKATLTPTSGSMKPISDPESNAALLRETPANWLAFIVCV
jgi:hypothetical protein